MKIKICAAQMEVRSLDVEANLEKASSMVVGASREGCDFICFPEEFLIGLVGEKISEYAQEIPGEHTAKFSRLARDNGIHIVMGSIVEKEGSDFYNTSVLIDDSGEILGKYRKINLWNGEKLRRKPGDRTFVFDTKYGKVGIEICWDVAFPEVSKEMALNGARIIFCPSLWSYEDKHILIKSEEVRRKIPKFDTESNFMNACIPARAMENEVVFVYVNGCGKDEFAGSPVNLVGNSQIAVPFYGRVASFKDEEGLLISKVDLDLLDLAESAYEIKRSSLKK